MQGRSWFALKDVALQQRQEAASPMRRSLTLLDLVALGIGSIMGTGVFVLTGKAAAHAGPGVMLSYGIAALCAGLAAMCYAEMAGMLPVSGSAYLYAYATLGESVAFLLGWVLALLYLIGAATLGVGFSGYAQSLMGHLGGNFLPPALGQAPWAFDVGTQSLHPTGSLVNLPAAAIILAVAWLLNGGVQLSARATRAMVAVKLGVVLLFLAVAAPKVNPELWHPLVVPNRGTFGDLGPSGILQGAMLLFFAYMGFDAVSAAARETVRPARTMPLGILIALSVCAALYVAVAACLTGLVPYQALDVPYPMALGARAAQAPWLETVIDVGALVGLSSVLLAQLYVQPRLLMAMAEDGLLPQAARALHPVRRVPHRLTWLTATLAATSAGLLPVDVLAEFTSLGILIVFATVALGVSVQRVRQPTWPRHFRVPFGPYLIPGASVCVSLVLMGSATRLAISELGLWVLLGVGVYAGYGRRARARTGL